MDASKSQTPESTVTSFLFCVHNVLNLYGITTHPNSVQDTMNSLYMTEPIIQKNVQARQILWNELYTIRNMVKDDVEKNK